MAKYNDDQLSQYFKHVALPEESLTRKPSIEFLRELHRRQVITVPFEGLALHYSKFHLLSLDPGDLFKKVVERNMGGYCMEMNNFFGTILRSLGFAVMSTGARLSHEYVGRGGEGYLGWCVARIRIRVLLLTPSGATW
jgi:arylamine N-acetyltransferase